MQRFCVQEKTHGIARKSANVRSPRRRAGREPMFKLSISSIGVAEPKSEHCVSFRRFTDKDAARGRLDNRIFLRAGYKRRPDKLRNRDQLQRMALKKSKLQTLILNVRGSTVIARSMGTSEDRLATEFCRWSVPTAPDVGGTGAGAGAGDACCG